MATAKVSVKANLDPKAHTVEEMQAIIDAQAAQLEASKSNTPQESGATASYNTEPGVLIYFSAKPEKTVLELLKSRGFTFRMTVGSERKPAWIGPAAGLIGTPFEVK